MDQDTFYPHAHEGLTLLAFLTALKTQVQDLTHDDLTVRLVKYAETIPAEERMAFLRYFTASAQPEEEQQEYESDPSLLEDVEAFAAEVRNRKYVEDWDWDDSDNIVVTGDTSWPEDMADLFSRTDAVFFAGDFATAAPSYESLLTLFALQEDTGEGYFPGENDPATMVGINDQETVARLLRSLLANNDAQSAERFVNTLAEMSQQFFLQLSLKDILEASPQPLPDIKQFLLAVEPLYTSRAHGMPDYSRPDWGKLLREATVMRSGTDGLGTLAREMGAQQPEAYYEWILALRNEGRHDEALIAAQHAVADVQLPRAKGILANTLGVMFDKRNADEDAWRAKELAWHSYPSRYNLTVLLSHNHVDETMMLACLDDEYARYQRGEWDLTGLEYTANPMRILFLALAGDLNRIATEAYTTSGLGWSSLDHIGYPACTMLLLTLLNPPTLPPAGSMLATYVQGVMQRATTSGLQTLIPSPDTENAVDYPRLLIARILASLIDKGQRTSYRDTVKQLVLRRVEEIVSNQHRKAYDRAAQIIVAYAEAVMLSGQSDDVTAFPRALLGKYPRHSAFHASLRTQWHASSVVRKVAL